MFDFFKKTKEDTQKEVILLDKPVVIDGGELKTKLDERLVQLKESVKQIENILKTEYVACIEGSLKAEKRREFQKVLHDYRLKELWIARLLKVIDIEKRYALSLPEAISLGIIEDAIIE